MDLMNMTQLASARNAPPQATGSECFGGLARGGPSTDAVGDAPGMGPTLGVHGGVWLQPISMGTSKDMRSHLRSTVG
jgi:hypothetical protein